MAQTPQVLKRKIGKLNIIDLKGDFVGSLALSAHEKMRNMFDGEKHHKWVINLKPLQMIDSVGVKAILEHASKRGTGIIKGKLAVMELFDSYLGNSDIRLIKNEEELVRYYGKDMIDMHLGKSNQPDQRRHQRIKTALPLILRCVDPSGEKVQFNAIVTNLSESGFFAEYIDLDAAFKSYFFTNPYDLKMLDLEIKLLDDRIVSARGKVVRRKIDGEQAGIAVEFYDLDDRSKQMIKLYLIRS